MTRFYLCAPYRRREELLEYARDLEALGHVVVSRWIEGNREALQPSLVHDPELAAMRQEVIGENLGDLGSAEALINFSEPQSVETIAARARWFGERMKTHGWDAVAEQHYAEIERRERTAEVRGTRHVELGIAIALELNIIQIGPPENIFHQAEFVSRFATWHDFIEAQRAAFIRGGHHV